MTPTFRRIKHLAAILLLAGVNALTAQDGEPLTIGAVTVLPDGPGMLELGAGAFNAFIRENDAGGGGSAAVNLEYRAGQKLFYLGPLFGVLVNADGGAFVYAGAYADLRYRRFILTPSLAAGAYEQGSGPDLGGTLQFRSSVTVAYELEHRSRIGVRVAHISNARLHSENPGENEVLLIYGFRF